MNSTLLQQLQSRIDKRSNKIADEEYWLKYLYQRNLKDSDCIIETRTVLYKLRYEQSLDKRLIGLLISLSNACDLQTNVIGHFVKRYNEFEPEWSVKHKGQW